jgi:hypothetical protein
LYQWFLAPDIGFHAQFTRSSNAKVGVRNIGGGFFLSVAAGQVKPGQPEAYSAVAVGTGGAVGARSIQFSFRINRYTTDEEVNKLATLLGEKGPDALREKRFLHSLGVPSATQANRTNYENKDGRDQAQEGLNE